MMHRARRSAASMRGRTRIVNESSGTDYETFVFDGQIGLSGSRRREPHDFQQRLDEDRMDIIVKDIKVNKFGVAGLVGGAPVAALLGPAAPAQADLAHNIWANQQNQGTVQAPTV